MFCFLENRKARGSMNNALKRCLWFLIVGIFVSSLSADTTDVKGTVEKDAQSEDLLIEDDDADILSASEISKDTASLKKDSSKTAAVEKVKEADEELILDGGEEDLLGGVRIEKPKDTVTATVNADKQSTDSAVAAVKGADTLKSESSAKTASKPVLKVAKDEQIVPVKIENTSSINFARNLKEYRNPKIAMLLSLLLPGSGEVYAKNGVRAGIFGAVEVGLIATGIAFNVRGGNKVDDAHDFANQHYKAEKMYNYYKMFNTIYGKRKDPETNVSNVDSIFLNYGDLPAKDFSNKSKDFYELINDEVTPYIHGWDDATPALDNNFKSTDTNYFSYQGDTTAGSPDSSYLFVNKKDSSKVSFGFSANRDIYSDKIKKANKQYKYSQTFFTLLLVNHILSAIDAGICAKAYNDKLLGKQSMWQRINIKSVAVNSGSGIANGYALEVRF